MVRTSAEIRQIVRKYVKALEPVLRVERVVLYGSYANGKPHEWSDLDLAIISRDFASKDRWDRQRMLAYAKIDDPLLVDAMIEPLGYSVAEYNHAHHLTFLGEIKRTGKTVYLRRKRATKRQRAKSSRA